MKKWRKTTSTSPSGRHLGHYKVLVSTIDRSLQEDVVKDLQSIQRDIKICYIGLINYCVKYRYSLQCWKIIVNMMIYKEPGNVKIHRLRVIHLYEADQSLLWRIKWGERMRAAVNEITLHPGQYGGLSGRACTSSTFFEELRFDYASLTTFSFANFNNDACSCYDRILCALASLAGKKYRVHKDVIFVYVLTLEETKFKLKFSEGIFASSYNHCAKFPLHGTGQRSTNSPIIWHFVSSVIFQTHEQHAH